MAFVQIAYIDLKKYFARLAEYTSFEWPTGCECNLKSEIMKKVIDLLGDADIVVNGSRPWDIQVHNDRLYQRILLQGSLGLGEAYMDRWWEVDRLDEFFTRLLRNRVDQRFVMNPQNIFEYLKAWTINLQTRRKASANILHHYDIGYDLYQFMLGRTMSYTCGYWDEAQNLDEAQEAKMDLICRKINIQPDDHILDIGCGWGSFARFAAEKYGARVTGITISNDQLEHAREICAGLPVEIKLQDYRDVREKYDKIVSMGMMEHVGYKNHQTYINTAARALKAEGIFLIQVIGGNVTSRKTDNWISKYIFPNGVIPSIRQIGKVIENKLVMEDWHNFGPDYDKTLLAWFANFDENWDHLKSRYSDRFYRMWKYYLLCCAGAFRARSNQLWHIVLTRNGLENGYRPQRYSTSSPVLSARNTGL